MNEIIEKAFETTTKIILGKKLANLSEYKNWLMKHVPQSAPRKSAISNKTVYTVNPNSYEFQGYIGVRAYFENIKHLAVTQYEALEMGKKQILLSEIENSKFTDIIKKLSKIAFITLEKRQGPEQGPEDAMIYWWSSNCFEGMQYNYDKYCCYCFFPKYSENIFGSMNIYHSSFCINCYESSKLTRCFEVAESTNCRDCYFCYNCENLDNCMFCSNATSKRYAIANIEVGKEEYLKFKKKILEEITQKLEKDKTIKWDIYNIGCAKVKK